MGRKGNLVSFRGFHRSGGLSVLGRLGLRLALYGGFQLVSKLVAVSGSNHKLFE